MCIRVQRFGIKCKVFTVQPSSREPGCVPNYSPRPKSSPFALRQPIILPLVALWHFFFRELCGSPRRGESRQCGHYMGERWTRGQSLCHVQVSIYWQLYTAGSYTGSLSGENSEGFCEGNWGGVGIWKHTIYLVSLMLLWEPVYTHDRLWEFWGVIPGPHTCISVSWE